MGPKLFRTPEWKQVWGWSRMVGGVCLILILSVEAAKEMVRVWPNWDWVIWAVFVAIALLLSFGWTKQVRKAIEEGEFD
jgi:hypothetical protein